MTEHLVGSRLPDLRQIIVDLVLRYRMRPGGRRPLTPERMKWHAKKFEEANARVPAPPFVSFDPVDVGSSSVVPGGNPGVIPAEWVTLGDQGARGGAPGVVLYFHGPPRPRDCLPQGSRSRLPGLGRRRRGGLSMARRERARPEGYRHRRRLRGRQSRPCRGPPLRREGETLPGGLILFSPWADLGCEGPSYRKNVLRDAMFHAESVRATGSYLMRDCDPRDPEVSPVHADLTGFPPMLLFAGTRELFVDDARTIARRATANGVRAELHVYRHMPHVFPLLVDVLPRAAPAYETIQRFVSQTQRGPAGRA